MNVNRLRVLLPPLFVGCTAPAVAADCTVNVLDAYNVAKLRGWNFHCETTGASGIAGIVANFVTYPPNAIGCTFKTPIAVGPTFTLGGFGHLFSSSTAPVDRLVLMNGWKVKTYEISGGQWAAWPHAPQKVRLPFVTKETAKPNRTYNFKLNKLVLTHPTSTCSKALDEAF
ncbi:MAG: hypothetical protein KIS79_05175 [Burkholderiales bacterium]|nr:hypothetical protein [Burkholderiales bacterium]